MTGTPAEDVVIRMTKTHIEEGLPQDGKKCAYANAGNAGILRALPGTMEAAEDALTGNILIRWQELRQDGRRETHKGLIEDAFIKLRNGQMASLASILRLNDGNKKSAAAKRLLLQQYPARGVPVRITEHTYRVTRTYTEEEKAEQARQKKDRAAKRAAGLIPPPVRRNFAPRSIAVRFEAV